MLHIYCIYDSDMTHGEKGHSRSHSGLDGVICVAVLYWITNHSCLLSALQRPRKSILALSIFGIRSKRLYITHALHVQLWVDGRGLAVLKVVLDVMIYLHGKQHQL